MLVTSRSALEYRAMFDLGPAEASWSVVDCCAGGSSFAAEGGDRVLAVDPAYAVGAARLAARVSAALGDGGQMIDDNSDRFQWDWYGNPGRRAELRRRAATDFLADLGRRPSRYVAGSLPCLPLADGCADLALCSHLLFTWADRFGFVWHRDAIAELVRVARREVRIFPLVLQGTGEPVEFLDPLRAWLRANGHESELRPVPYRFQRGAREMLVVDAVGPDARVRAHDGQLRAKACSSHSE